jgi:D-alanine-D-alanine ligase
MRIAVIYGGDKSVDGVVINPTMNTRPWKSYQAVAEDIADALIRLGCEQVYLMPEDMGLGERLRWAKIDMAWLNTGGVQGYEPMAHAPAMLEMLGIPYVGHDPLRVSTLDNKHAFKRNLKALGIPTAPFMTWHLNRGPFPGRANGRFRQVFGDYAGPFVVKPVCGRASVYVHLVEDVAGLSDAVTQVYEATDNHVLIETFLPGREFCIAVCGFVTARHGRLVRHGNPFAFAGVERMLEPDEKIFTSMDVRPITSDRVRPLDPMVDAKVLMRLEDLAREVFVELDLQTLIRLDVRADAAGDLVVLEANPKPDLKAPTQKQTSLVCAVLAQQGMSYDDLILSLIADRLDVLLSERRGTVTHLTALLE